MILRFLSALLLLMALSSPAAVNTTTPGSVTVLSTFQCISVKAQFTNDANANNSAAIQYKRTSDSTWKDAYTPMVDRRATVALVASTQDNSNNVNQARGSIVGLTANTSYDVKVTWSDPDGVVGTASITNTISTLSYSPPTNGVTRYVDASAGSEGNGSSGSPWKTITNALINATQGDTILVAPGRYRPFLITSNGTSSGYYVLKTNGAGQVSIQGGISNNCIYISASYWVIDGFNLEQSVAGGVHISSGHDIFIQNTLQTNAISDTSETAVRGCIELYGAVTNVFILTNSWTTYNTTTTNDSNGYVDNVDMGGNPPVDTVVVADNMLTGGWDGVGNHLNGGFNGNGNNSDICRNTFLNWADDLVELDGTGPNIRVFSNHALKYVVQNGTYRGSLMSDAGTFIGPAYVFRNFIEGWFTNSDGTSAGQGIGIKLGAEASTAPTYYFHNTMATRPTGSHEVSSEGYGVANASSNKVFRCNIFVGAGNIYYRGGSGNDHDYDLGYCPLGNVFADTWNGVTNYNTLSLFQSGAGQETHGVGTNPLLNTDLTIPFTSPAVNAGVTLTNFNDASSAWPSIGAGPDIGAFEVPLPQAISLSGKNNMSGKYKLTFQ